MRTLTPWKPIGGAAGLAAALLAALILLSCLYSGNDGSGDGVDTTGQISVCDSGFIPVEGACVFDTTGQIPVCDPGFIFVDGACACYDPLLKGDFVADTVWPMLRNNCTGCHGSYGHFDAPNLKMGSLAQFLETAVEKASFQIPPFMLIDSGSHNTSFLYQKLQSRPLRGVQMPFGSALSDSEITLVARWIDMGAPPPSSGLPYPGYVSHCEACPDLSQPMTTEDSALTRWGNGRCHPCNQPDSALRPDYCVGPDFFIDSLLPRISTHSCAFFCHQNSEKANANLVLDARPGVADAHLTMGQRVTNIYNGLVNVKTFTEPTVYPYYRVSPSDTAGSFFFKQVFLKRPDMGSPYQKEKSLMPPGIKPDPVLGSLVRKWILSGAPGPGDSLKINQFVPDTSVH